MGVPAELRTARLLLRSWRPDDATDLLPVLETNREHLGSWIPARVANPAPLPELAERLSGFAADFAADREWRYAILAADESSIFGEVDLFPRSAAGRVSYDEADRGEIGYWLREDATGQGLINEAVRAIIGVALTLPRIGHLEIRCDSRNSPSAAVPRRLGFRLAESVERPDDGRLQIWTSSRDELLGRSRELVR